ncbi:MAG TPA: stage 0 sporulation family protein [Bacillota bacterium]|nr:stage 0 sporulation family protein [Bacillota bacterium]
MVEVVGIRFKKAGKIYYFDPADSGVKAGEADIVETARGVEYGDVVTGPREVAEESIVQPLKKVIRKATAEDTAQMENNASREKEAYKTCLKKITDHQLPMKLVDVEFTFDNNKIIFYFTADGRIDFRELVKDLAAVFRTRIELRQIGVRDEAKMVGGLGCCGRVLCCHSFLGDFEPVSIRMAKEQNLSLNPTKISGACGRLMCCLKYENDAYEADKKEYPSLGTCLNVNQVEGKVCAQNILKKTVTIEIKDTRQHLDVPLETVRAILHPKRDGDANGAD